MAQITVVDSRNMKKATLKQWHSCIPAAVSGLIILMAGVTNKWSFIGVPANGSNFGDLRVITTAAQCASVDPSWNIASVPCDPSMAMYNYPSFWAQGFARLVITSDSTPWLAATFIMVFLIGLTVITYSLLKTSQSPKRLLIISTLASVTPPVFLGAQRGNIDLVVFAFMSLGLVLVASTHRYSGAVALAIATTLKLFPVGSGLALLLDSGKRAKALTVFIVLSVIGVALSIGDLRFISEKTPQLDGASFGSALLPFLFESHTSTGLSATAFKLLGWLAFLLVWIAMQFIASRGSAPAHVVILLCSELRSNRASSALFLGSSGAFLVAYLVGPSFDYRLIFLIPAIGALAALQSRAALWLSVVLLLQLVLSYSNFIGAVQYLSDLMLLVLAPLLGVMCLRLIRSPHE